MNDPEGLAESIPIAEPPPVRVKRKYKKRNEKPEVEPCHRAVFLDVEEGGDQGWIL